MRGAAWLVTGLSLATAGTAAAQNVAAYVEDIDAGYADGTFGRELTLEIRYGTGLEQFVNDVRTVTCTQPAGLGLALTLPAGTRFVFESRGGGVFDPVPRTVNWNLGPAPLDPDECVAATIDVGIEVSPAVADGAELEATAVIVTTSAGDDPGDNAVTESFQVGFLPFEVFATDFAARCTIQASFFGGGVVEFEEIGVNTGGNRVSCAVSDLGLGITVPGQGSGRASIPVAGFDGPDDFIKVGQIDRGGSLKLDMLEAAAHAVGGWNCTISNCTERGWTSLSEAESSYRIVNPNPYFVPLHVRAGRILNASCSPFGRSVAELHDEATGRTATCDTGPVIVEDEFTLGTVSSVGTGEVEMRAAAGSVINRGPGGTVTSIERGTAQAVSRSRLELSLSADGFGQSAATLAVIAQSPVDLLLQDAAGRRTGVDAAGESPLGLVEMPGCAYSGADAEPETITCAFPSDGLYELEILGTGDGPYTITVETQDADGAVLTDEVYAGQASPGSVRRETFAVGGVAPPTVPEDFDSDGDVDFDDLALFIPALGSCEAQDAFDSGADLDGDGCVTLVDYQLWYTAFLEQQQ